MTSLHFIYDGCWRHWTGRCKICIRKGLGLRIKGLGLGIGLRQLGPVHIPVSNWLHVLKLVMVTLRAFIITV